RPARPTHHVPPGARPRRTFRRGRLAAAPAQLPHPRTTRLLPPASPRARLAGLRRVPSENRRLSVLPGQPRRLAGPPGGQGAASSEAAAAVLPIQRRSPPEVAPMDPAGLDAFRHLSVEEFLVPFLLQL